MQVYFLLLSLLCLCRGDLVVNQFGPALAQDFYAVSYDRSGSTQPYTMTAADDFTVPASYSMTINSVLFSGHFASGTFSDRNVRNWTVLIYGDSISDKFPKYHVPDTTNLIATQVQVATGVTFPTVTVNVTFGSPPTLQSGLYWVGIYASMLGPALTYKFNIDRLQTTTVYGERFVSKETAANIYPAPYQNKWVPYNESSLFQPGAFGSGGYNLAFNIYGSLNDISPPSVSSLIVTPSTLDYTSGKLMNFTILASDNEGVKSVRVSLQSPSQVNIVSLKLDRGNISIGYWVFSTGFAFDQSAGTWSIIDIDVEDYVGNWKNYSATDIQSLFGSSSFTVTNGPPTTTSSSSTTTTTSTSTLTTGTTTSSTSTSTSTTTGTTTTVSSTTTATSSSSAAIATAMSSTSTVGSSTSNAATTESPTTATTGSDTSATGTSSTTSGSSSTTSNVGSATTITTTTTASVNFSDVANINSKSSSLNMIPIIGGAAGGLIAMVVLALILFFVFRRRNRKQSKTVPTPEPPKNSIAMGNYNNFNSTASISSLYMPMSNSTSTTVSTTVSRNPSKLNLDNSVVISYSELKIETEVGSGAYGIVFRGRWRGGAVAIKQLSGRLTSKQLNDFTTEASIMKKLRPHVNVVQFLGVTLHPDPLCLVTEFLDQGSLYVYMRKNQLDIKMTMNVVKGIASGMLHLHSEGLIHRDLATRNILLGSGQQVKISDFGMSRENSEEQNHTKSETGPLKWMAPESIRDRVYSTATDVWSFGVTIWEIVVKENPFKELDSVQAALGVVHDNLRLKIPENAPFVLAKVMKQCFQTDPAQRPSFEEILSTLQNAAVEEWSFT